jgi:hypothetical protein
VFGTVCGVAFCTLLIASCSSDDGAAKAPSSTAASPSSDTAPGSDGCPSAAVVSAAYGAEVALVEASGGTGANGLVFCPYAEVLAPQATDAFGTPAIPNEFSITFTNLNVLDGGDVTGEEIPGLGEQAIWSESEELNIWTGSRSVIVSGSFAADADSRAIAIAIAKSVL